jgi:hypothetical protein
MTADVRVEMKAKLLGAISQILQQLRILPLLVRVLRIY